jgi:hypothetical protein
MARRFQGTFVAISCSLTNVSDLKLKDTLSIRGNRIDKVKRAKHDVRPKQASCPNIFSQESIPYDTQPRPQEQLTVARCYCASITTPSPPARSSQMRLNPRRSQNARSCAMTLAAMPRFSFPSHHELVLTLACSFALSLSWTRDGVAALRIKEARSPIQHIQ